MDEESILLTAFSALKDSRQ